jgi:hypothetical protein
LNIKLLKFLKWKLNCLKFNKWTLYCESFKYNI